MLPIPEGSWITASFVQDWRNIISGHAYIVLTLDDGIVFKVAENFLETENKLTLYSLNPIYKPYDVHVAQIKEIWQFVHYICSELPGPLTESDELLMAVHDMQRDIAMIKSKVVK
jgi:hypothetical protein